MNYQAAPLSVSPLTDEETQLANNLPDHQFPPLVPPLLGLTSLPVQTGSPLTSSLASLWLSSQMNSAENFVNGLQVKYFCLMSCYGPRVEAEFEGEIEAEIEAEIEFCSIIFTIFK